jgi:hypothetical protein
MANRVDLQDLEVDLSHCRSEESQEASFGVLYSLEITFDFFWLAHPVEDRDWFASGGGKGTEFSQGGEDATR